MSASQTVKVKVEATSGSETRSRSRRAAAPATGISTRSFDSELQDAAQQAAIYSPGVKGQNKVTKEQFGSTVMEQSAMIVRRCKTPWWCKCLPSVCDW